MEDTGPSRNAVTGALTHDSLSRLKTKERDWSVPIKPFSLQSVSTDTQVTFILSGYKIGRTASLDHDPSQSGIHFADKYVTGLVEFILFLSLQIDEIR